MEDQEEILQRAMTRRQFIRFMGAAAVGVLGLTNVAAVLKKPNQALATVARLSSKGFGSRKFGE